MEKIKEFLKNKGIGYYIVAGDILLALILAIAFLLSYKGAMANNAASQVPETIAIFLFAGIAVELAFLFIPQYRFVHVAGIVMYGLALFKEVILIPNLIADEVNNVHYQGGNLGISLFYLITLLVINAAAIAAAFIGFYKKEEDLNADFPIAKDDMGKIIKVAACGVVVLAAVLTSSLVSVSMQKKMNLANASGDAYNPITPEIKKAAEEYDYSFNPSEVLIKEEAEYSFSGINSKVSDGTTRDGHNMVYYFEGAYAEGYQGDYSQTYAYLCLWEDGLFGGKINSTSARGYWFNSSLAEGVGEDGKDVKDCLKMVSNVDHYDSIIAQEATGFYTYQAYAYLGFSWGTRSMILNGYEYYPEVALALNTQNAELETVVGEDYDMSSWVPTRILKNLTFSSVFKPVDVDWSVSSGKVTIAYVDDNKSRGISSITANFAEAGEQTVTIKWSGFEASVKVNVKAAE